MAKRKLVLSDITDIKTSMNVLPVVTDDKKLIFTNHWVLGEVSTVIKEHAGKFQDVGRIDPVDFGGKKAEWNVIINLARKHDIDLSARINWASVLIILDKIGFNKEIKESFLLSLMKYRYINQDWSKLPYECANFIKNYTLTIIRRSDKQFYFGQLCFNENLLKMINDLGLQRDIFNNMIEITKPPVNFILV